MDVNVTDFRQLYAEKSAECVRKDEALLSLLAICESLDVYKRYMAAIDNARRALEGK